MEARTVGKFSYDPETDEISGPMAYMVAQGFELIRRSAAGVDATTNAGDAIHRDRVLALLVSLQTDYAGWVGFPEMLSWDRRSR